MAVLVGKPAPDFTATTVMGDNTINETFKFSDFLKDKYGILFFYPLDFTFVCPSEILAFEHRLDAFKERNCEVVAVSVDSEFSHLAWKNTPVEKGGLGQVRFPIVADLDKTIARNYDVLVNAEPSSVFNDEGDEISTSINGTVAFRGTFLIDRAGIVRHQVVNDLPLGRNVDEAIRMIDALQFHEEHGEVCPAGWQKGKTAMKATPEGVAEYLANHSGEL